jgi:hypothetical protein
MDFKDQQMLKIKQQQLINEMFPIKKFLKNIQNNKNLRLTQSFEKVQRVAEEEDYFQIEEFINM